MGKEKEAACPCCRGSIERFPDQDGACGYQCIHCGWSQRVPASEDIAAAQTLHAARQGAQQADKPTIVLFVKGGVVQAAEGRADVRVVLCDLDSPEDERTTVGGRPCVIGIWDPLEEPSMEFDEALRLADQ